MKNKPTTLTELGDLLNAIDDRTGLHHDAARKIETLMDGPAIVVAASDSPAQAKAHADYVCDGVADDVEIMAAINALPALSGTAAYAKGGGRVLLSEGTFNCTATLDLDGKIIVLEGAGRESTRLNFTLSLAGACINLDRTASLQGRAVLRRFTIVGDDSTTAQGILLASEAAHNLVEDVSIFEMAEACVKGVGGNNQNTFRRVYARGAAQYGFKMYGNFNTYYGCIATNSTGDEGLYSGFHIQESGSFYFGCVSEKYTVGFNIQTYAYGVGLYGCYAENAGKAIDISGTAGDEPKGIQIVGGIVSGMTSATEPAVHIRRSKGALISGIGIFATTSGKDIEITSDALDAVIIGGYTSGATPVTNAGVRTRIIGLNGYINYNKGAAASTADGGTIAHGLSSTPTIALVQTSESGEMASVTGLDGTNITVAIKKHDGTAGTTQTIYWEAAI